MGLSLLVLIAGVARGGLAPSVLLLLLVMPLQLLFLAGVAWLLGAVGAVLRDVKELVTVVLMVGMFLTPIFYVERDVPATLRTVIALNPMTHLLHLYRDALLGVGLVHPVSLAIFGAVAFLTFLAGFLVFERTRVFLSDLL